MKYNDEDSESSHSTAVESLECLSDFEEPKNPSPLNTPPTSYTLGQSGSGGQLSVNNSYTYGAGFGPPSPNVRLGVATHVATAPQSHLAGPRTLSNNHDLPSTFQGNVQQATQRHQLLQPYAPPPMQTNYTPSPVSRYATSSISNTEGVSNIYPASNISPLSYGDGSLTVSPISTPVSEYRVGQFNSASFHGQRLVNPSIYKDKEQKEILQVSRERAYTNTTYGRDSSISTQSRPSNILKTGSRIRSTDMIEGNQRIVRDDTVVTSVKIRRKKPKRVKAYHQRKVPRTVCVEEFVEEFFAVQEKIIEMAKPLIKESLVETVEIEIIEVPVEEIQVKLQEKIIEVPKIITTEKVVEVPGPIIEKVVEVPAAIPTIEYVDIPQEKIVEVPEIQEEIIVREVMEASYVDVEVPRVVYIQDDIPCNRSLPVPVEAIVKQEYILPTIVPRSRVIKFPVFLPRFIEIPVSDKIANAMDIEIVNGHAAEIAAIANSRVAVSLCEIERVAEDIVASGVIERARDASNNITREELLGI